MPPEEQLSPEEKLLRLIQKPEPVQAKPASDEDAPVSKAVPAPAPAAKPAAGAGAAPKEKLAKAAVAAAGPAATAAPKPSEKAGAKPAAAAPSAKAPASKAPAAEPEKEEAPKLPEKLGAPLPSEPDSGPEEAEGAEPEAQEEDVSIAMGPPRKGPSIGPGPVLTILNRGLAMAVFLLMCGLVLEIMAEKPGIPEGPGSTAGLEQEEMPAPPLSLQSVIDAVTNNQIFVQRHDGDPIPTSTSIVTRVDNVASYVATRMTIDGIAMYDDVSRTVAVVTDQGTADTRYLRVGDEFAILEGRATLKVERIEKKQVVFVHNNRELILKGK